MASAGQFIPLRISEKLRTVIMGSREYRITLKMISTQSNVVCVVRNVYHGFG